MDDLKEVEFPIESVQTFLVYWAKYGQQMIVTLVMLVAGIFLIQRAGPMLGNLLEKCGVSSRVATEIVVGISVALAVMLLGVVLWNLGVGGTTVRQLLMAAGLLTAAAMLLLRPYLPKLPFRVGNMIKTGDLLGKVEDISLLNTRLKTFDGLIVMVPNAKILNDYVINYHTTPNRRVRINVAIQYDQDIARAKQIIESLMIQDPRILPTPRPVVYVINLDDSWIEIGGRGWVKNPKAWVTRCELLEKVKYAFDHVGIEFAFPRRDVHLFRENEESLANPQQIDESIDARDLHP